MQSATIMKYWKYVILILLVSVLGCGVVIDEGEGTPSSGDEEDDTTPSGDEEDDAQVPIDGVGEAELEYEMQNAPAPLSNLPSLEGVDPDVNWALASQVLPDESEKIHEIEKWSNSSSIATELREKGIVRSPGHSESMQTALMDLVLDYSEPDIFLTSDAIFELFHNYFDNILLGVELSVLSPHLKSMLVATRIEAAKRYNALPDGATKRAALDIVAYLQVAESLIDPDTDVLDAVKKKVEKEIKLIMAHEGYNPSPIFDRPARSEGVCASCDPCVSENSCVLEDKSGICPERYCEDYSQYVPRGHYTHSLEMEQYFRAMMWLGRITLLNRSDQSTRGAVVLMDSLKGASVEVKGADIKAIELWRMFFSLIGTLVGSMDDLNVAQYDEAVLKAAGDSMSLADLDNADVLNAIHNEIALLPDPQIALGGLRIPQESVGAETKGLRLLGQSFVPDNFAIAHLMSPSVGPNPDAEHYSDALDVAGISMDADPEEFTLDQKNAICEVAFDWNNKWWDVCRTMPTGLDVAAALGSDRAESLARARNGKYAQYETRLDEIIDEFDSFTLSDWSSSVSRTWLYAIRGLFEKMPEGAPAFMRTDAWADKTLETGLTSWAEMRHDTILYSKQYEYSDADGDSDTDGDVDYDFDYLEPQPKAYSRLNAAAKRLNKLMTGNEIFSDETAELSDEINSLSAFIDEAIAISIRELEGEPLQESDIAFIRRSGFEMHMLQESLLNTVGIESGEDSKYADRLKSTLVADVYTFGPRQSVLEVGSGYLDSVCILHQLPGGQWGVAMGPAFSYHEFEQPMENRLTDEAWRDMLSDDSKTGRPDWLTQY